MVILLMGLLGSGKTSIGTVLAQELDYTCIEMDDYILSKTQYSSVNEAYDSNIAEWKEKELEASKELSKKDNIVIISTAALVENNLNIRYFKENTKDLRVIYLQTKPEILTNRMINLYDEFKKTGPKMVLMAMEKHYKKRDTLYSACADLIVHTEECTPEEAKNEILQKIQIPSTQIYA